MSQLTNLEIKKFIDNGSFFFDSIKEDAKVINFIKTKSTHKFGEDERSIIYTFKHESYDIEFILDEKNQIIKAEQVEIHRKPLEPYLSSIFNYYNFINQITDIEEIYTDDVETVIFIKNGINVYFNNESLAKITSECKASRKLVKETMKKIDIKN